MKVKGKSKIGHRKSEKNGEFGCFGSEFLVFQKGYTIILGPPTHGVRDSLNVMYPQY